VGAHDVKWVQLTCTEKQRAKSICFRPAAPLQMYTMTPFKITIMLKKKYMMFGIKIKSFLCRFQKSIPFLGEKMSPKKVNIKELQPLFTPFLSSVAIFRGVSAIRHATLRTTILRHH
jgi:hypothetical protein